METTATTQWTVIDFAGRSSDSSICDVQSHGNVDDDDYGVDNDDDDDDTPTETRGAT